MLILTTSPGAIYQFSGGQKIPYFFYLRMLYLLSVSPFKVGTRSSMAFLLASLRGEGYEASDSLIAALVDEFRGLTNQKKALLRTIDPAQMRERYDDIVWNQTLYHMDSQAPVAPQQKSTSVATLLRYAREDRHESKNAVGNANAEKHENFDLSRTSVPITGYNYQDYMYSDPQTPIAPLSVVDESEPPDNHLPATMWPRAPAYGTPHVDAFTGMELKTVHKPVYNPFTNQQYNQLGDGDENAPLLDPIAMGLGMLADKTVSVLGTLKGKFVARQEFWSFSRWSTDNFCLEGLESGADADPTPTPDPEARMVSKTTKSSKLGQPWDQIRGRNQDRALSASLEPDIGFMLFDVEGTAGTTKQDNFVEDELAPTLTNLPRLWVEDYSLRRSCGFEESVRGFQERCESYVQKGCL